MTPYPPVEDVDTAPPPPPPLIVVTQARYGFLDFEWELPKPRPDKWQLHTEVLEANPATTSREKISEVEGWVHRFGIQGLKIGQSIMFRVRGVMELTEVGRTLGDWSEWYYHICTERTPPELEGGGYIL